jgi:hypothetical protein
MMMMVMVMVMVMVGLCALWHFGFMVSHLRFCGVWTPRGKVRELARAAGESDKKVVESSVITRGRENRRDS